MAVLMMKNRITNHTSYWSIIPVREEWTAWTSCGKNTNTRLSLCDASNATSMFDRTVISTSVKRYKGKDDEAERCSWPPLSSLYRKLIRVLACLKQTQWIVYQFYFDIFGMTDKHCKLPMHIITNKHLDYFTQMASKKAVKTCQSVMQTLIRPVVSEDTIYTSDRGTLEQLFEALMGITPEPI
ncbi:hypothetical protein T06_16764 [Trichinella sp. T6]|nr:hypothetical protein T06_16764 [Trichinella sp. T6]